MVDHDRLFKELLTDVTRGERHVVDLLARVRFRDAEDEPPSFVLVHVENQARPEADFARRLFLYFSALGLRFREPVYPIAVFSFAQPLRAESARHVVRLPGLEVLRFRLLRHS